MIFKTKNYYKNKVKIFEQNSKQIILKSPLDFNIDNLNVALKSINDNDLTGINSIHFIDNLNYLGLTISNFNNLKISSCILLQKNIYWLTTLLHEISHHCIIKQYYQKKHTRRFYKENLRLLEEYFFVLFNKVSLYQKKK